MTYRVLIQPPAADDLNAAFLWIAQASPARAEAWVAGAFRAIQTLTELPRRCPLATESDAFSEEIRQLLYGEFRILFTVDGDLVRFLHVRYGARQVLRTDELL